MVHREAPKSILVHVLFGLRKLLGVATFALIIVLLGPKLFVLFDNPKSATIPAKLFEAREYILSKSVPVLHRYVPTNIAGSDRSDWILIGLAIVITVFSGALAQRALTASNRRLLRKSAQAWRRKEGVKPGSKLDAELETTLRLAESGKAVNRQELLRVFAETKKKLDTFGREVAFLAIDVVGSAGMKAGEDHASIQYDFEEYRKLVERIFRARGVLKTAWTPDGVMACFAHVEDACQSGKDVIKSSQGVQQRGEGDQGRLRRSLRRERGSGLFRRLYPPRDDLGPRHRRRRAHAEERRAEYRAGGTQDHRAIASA